jgi:hypothetical protein
MKLLKHCDVNDHLSCTSRSRTTRSETAHGGLSRTLSDITKSVLAFAAAERARYARIHPAEQHHPDFKASSMLNNLLSKHKICIYAMKDSMEMADSTLYSTITSIVLSYPEPIYNGIPSSSHNRRNRQTRRLCCQCTSESEHAIRNPGVDT